MPTPQKEAIIQEMSQKFSDASSIFLADFTGVDVNTINEIRKNFFDGDVDYRVVKNTLAKLSFKKAGIEGMDELLKGVNAYAISYDDPTRPIKIVEKMKKELDGKFAIKAAYFEGKIVTQNEVEALAKLPSLDELRSQLIGLLQAPLSKMVGVLQAPARDVVGVFKAYGEKIEY